MFGFDEGFDIVIGNPPYVRQEKIQEQKPQFKQIYDCYAGAADLFVYFYERSIKLLKPEGVFAFITSDKWYQANYGIKLREWMKQNTTLRSIIDFGDAPIFDALAYPTIVIAKRRFPATQPNSQDEARVLVWAKAQTDGKSQEEFPEIFEEQAFLVPQSGLRVAGWHLEGSLQRDLFNHISSIGKPLSKMDGRGPCRGILTGLNEAFVLARTEKANLPEDNECYKEILKPFLSGRHIKRWRVEAEDQWLIKIESSENKNHLWSGLNAGEAEKLFASLYPEIYEQLTANGMRNRLIERQDQGRYFWELRSCAYWPEFEKPKIVFPDIALSPQFAYDDDKHYVANTGYIIPDAQPWLLAILNSTVTAWYYAQISPRIMNGYFRFIKQYVDLIRIPEVDIAQQQILGVLVDVLRQERKLSASSWERFANGCVYELFFPKELHEANIRLFAEAEKAGIMRLTGLKREALIQQAEALADMIFKNDHVIFRMLFDLAGLDVVRTIEGRA